MSALERRSFGAWVRDALRLPKPRGGGFFFIVNNRNHVRIFAPVVRRLVELSLPCTIVDIERESGDRGARRELASVGLSSVSLAELTTRISRSDVLVVANDFYPDVVVATMHLCERQGTLRIGVVEGCRFTQTDRFRRVDHLLAWSAACREAFAIPVHVVGSPIIEQAWRRPASFATPEFAVINFKAPASTVWLEHAIAACKEIGIHFEISKHPSYATPSGFSIAKQEFRDLMPNATVLISQPSTAVFEAMAAGKPVVLFPTDQEALVEFADPKGAYEIAREPAELPMMLRTTLAGKDSYRDRCRAFFEFHVNIDLQVSATERIVQTLIGLAGRRIGRGRAHCAARSRVSPDPP